MVVMEAMAGCGQAVVSTGVSKLLTLLIAVQAAALASFGGGPDFDPKYYVDIPLRFGLNETAQAFDALPRSQNRTIARSNASRHPRLRLPYSILRYSLWGSQGPPLVRARLSGPSHSQALRPVAGGGLCNCDRSSSHSSVRRHRLA